ncbi:hypothetical protein E1258_31885 [Micromonospora sp. KC207]|uniref:hypothetical protein n=1 Tax=Micromonospora sp. KC207 TaxID=2530377 RepID=UPI0010478F63|nr:hypothetical protein [Micromonospora sp. KC207]TDC44361.1 hypothetical protein E1258_31885 [Micromonospora sp. KC207]
MTAALQSDFPPEGGWTTDDLDGLPEDGRPAPCPGRAGDVVHTNRFDPVNEVYTGTGRWTKFVDTGEPFPVNLSIARITPRHL